MKSSRSDSQRLSGSPSTLVHLPNQGARTSPSDEVIDFSIIEVFDFEKNWHLVKPFLHEPEIESMLIEGMNAYRRSRMMQCLECGQSAERWNGPYDPKLGPWSSDTQAWRLVEAEEKMDEAIASGKFPTLREDATDKEREHYGKEYWEFLLQFYPQPDTYQWYQIHIAHFLTPWWAALGKSVFPHLGWHILRGDMDSLAYGADDQGQICVLFNLLSFKEMSAKEMIESCGRLETEA